jgi:lipoate-protein ligase B
MRVQESYLLDLGITPYQEAHDLQTRLVVARKEGALDRDLFICLQHTPVFTLGRRGGRENLRVPEEFLKTQGIDIVHVERGGDITYHGPGQLVLYPILDLRKAGLGVVDFVTALEEVMIRTATEWGIGAERNALNRGVWVGVQKLGSIGIAVRRGISFHGLAFNVNTSLEHFGWIHPCGLHGISVVSMERILGMPVPLDEVRGSLLRQVASVFGSKLIKIRMEDLIQRINPSDS